MARVAWRLVMASSRNTKKFRKGAMGEGGWITSAMHFSTCVRSLVRPRGVRGGVRRHMGGTIPCTSLEEVCTHTCSVGRCKWIWRTYDHSHAHMMNAKGCDAIHFLSTDMTLCTYASGYFKTFDILCSFYLNSYFPPYHRAAVLEITSIAPHSHPLS